MQRRTISSQLPLKPIWFDVFVYLRSFSVNCWNTRYSGREEIVFIIHTPKHIRLGISVDKKIVNTNNMSPCIFQVKSYEINACSVLSHTVSALYWITRWSRIPTLVLEDTVGKITPLLANSCCLQLQGDQGGAAFRGNPITISENFSEWSRWTWVVSTLCDTGRPKYIYYAQSACQHAMVNTWSPSNVVQLIQRWCGWKGLCSRSV